MHCTFIVIALYGNTPTVIKFNYRSYQLTLVTKNFWFFWPFSNCTCVEYDSLTTEILCEGHASLGCELQEWWSCLWVSGSRTYLVECRRLTYPEKVLSSYWEKSILSFTAMPHSHLSEVSAESSTVSQPNIRQHQLNIRLVLQSQLPPMKVSNQLLLHFISFKRLWRVINNTDRGACELVTELQEHQWIRDRDSWLMKLSCRLSPPISSKALPLAQCWVL